MRKLTLGLCLGGALLLTSSHIISNLAQTTLEWVTAKQELQKAAKAHKVKINLDRMTVDQKLRIARAPIVGFAKSAEGDLAKGAPFELVVNKSNGRVDVPDGSYVVKVQVDPAAKTGKTIFVDAGGGVVAQREFPPMLVLSDDLRPGATGVAVDTCRVYAEMFPTRISAASTDTCGTCACLHYNWGRSRVGVGTRHSLSGEINGWFIGRDAGLACMTSRPPTCQPIPAPPGE